MSEIEFATLHFYGWWQALTCFFAFLALWSIWWHLGRKKMDYAQIWLAFSILCWSLTGFLEVYYAQKMAMPQEGGQSVSELRFQLSGYSSLLSLANSFFILLALPWFKHIPTTLQAIVKSKFWNYIIGIPFLFSVLPTFRKIYLAESVGIVSELDVYYSIFTLIFLGMILWTSFAKRRLQLLAWLSLICILITLIAQVYKFTGNEIDMRLFSAVFKTTLIMIFFALAMSWVKDLSETIVASTASLRMRKVGNVIKIWGIAGKEEVEVGLSTMQSDLLQKFIAAKLDDNRWLEIKPKSARKNEQIYPISDHNEVKRLISALLDGIYGKGNWTKDQHERPFKEQLLETPAKGVRKIRLAIPKENLELG